MMLGMAPSRFTVVPVLLRLPSTGWGFVPSHLSRDLSAPYHGDNRPLTNKVSHGLSEFIPAARVASTRPRMTPSKQFSDTLMED